MIVAHNRHVLLHFLFCWLGFPFLSMSAKEGRCLRCTVSKNTNTNILESKICQGDISEKVGAALLPGRRPPPCWCSRRVWSGLEHSPQRHVVHVAAPACECRSCASQLEQLLLDGSKAEVSAKLNYNLWLMDWFKGRDGRGGSGLDHGTTANHDTPESTRSKLSKTA